MADAKKLKDYIKWVVDGARGIYIPKYFADTEDMDKWGVRPVDAEVLKLGPAGPDADGYWPTWDVVLENARLECEDGSEYHLETGEGGSIFAVLDGYSLEDDNDIVIPPEKLHLKLLDRALGKKSRGVHTSEYTGFELENSPQGWRIVGPKGEVLHYLLNTDSAGITAFDIQFLVSQFERAKALWLCDHVDYHIQAIDYHRNGVGGEGFYTVSFDYRDGHYPLIPMGAILFPYPRGESGWGNCRTAVFRTDKAAEGDLKFFSNSWRGDHFSPVLERAVAKWSAYESFRLFGKWEDDPNDPPNPLDETLEAAEDAETEVVASNFMIQEKAAQRMYLEEGGPDMEVAEVDFAAVEKKVFAKMAEECGCACECGVTDGEMKEITSRKEASGYYDKEEEG